MEQPQPPPTPPRSRFKIWSLYLAFNFVVLIAVSSVQVQKENKKSFKAWGIALSILSLLLTTSTVALHLHAGYRSIILNSKTELLIILTLVFFWTALVGIVSSPTSGLAVYDDGAVYLGNMYYFSWAGFITGVVLLASFVEQMYGISVVASFQNSNNNNHNHSHGAITQPQPQSSSTTTTTTTTSSDMNIKAPSMSFIYWSSLMVCSLIVMGSSAQIYNQTCEIQVNLKPQPFCSRTVFAITTGTMTTISCLVVVITKLLYITIPFLLEAALSTILFVLYVIELFYVTGTDGPGAPLGNLYYFSWISFLCCMGIGKCMYEDYVYFLDVAQREFEEGRRRTNVPSLEMRDLEHGDDNDVQIGGVGGIGGGGGGTAGGTRGGEQYSSVSATGSPSSYNTSESIPSPVRVTASTLMDGREEPDTI